MNGWVKVAGVKRVECKKKTGRIKSIIEGRQRKGKRTKIVVVGMRNWLKGYNVLTNRLTHFKAT